MDSATRTEIQRIFGNRIRELRIKQGLSQEELAYQCEIDRSYIGQVERGERNITLVNIVKVAKGLGVEPFETLLPPSSKPLNRGGM